MDDLVRTQMQENHLIGVSIAIIDGGKIVKAQGYGFTDASRKNDVSDSTLFQAASISKPVTAVATLRLVEQRKLSLDENVNDKLRSWKIPENDSTKDKKVTLRGLLSHSGGMTIHGFLGYEAGTPLPSLVQILNGEKPAANSSPIRVFYPPGSKSQYSGGGYTVIQQLIIDATGESFSHFLDQTVLKPCGMSHSTFAQPLTGTLASNASSGFHAENVPVAGKWHVYPQLAAAGLWTTPTDLAHFIIGVQQSLAGKNDALLSQSMARQMLTVQKDSHSLGFFIGGNHNLRFYHSGQNEGFVSYFVATEDGKGFVFMANSDDKIIAQVLKKIFASVSREYHWAGASVSKSPTEN